jgi:hypothetical protein
MLGLQGRLGLSKQHLIKALSENLCLPASYLIEATIPTVEHRMWVFPLQFYFLLLHLSQAGQRHSTRYKPS